VSRGPQTFRQRDLTTALKAAKAAGREIARLKLDKQGRIVVILTTESNSREDRGSYGIAVGRTLKQMRCADRNAWSTSEHRFGDRNRKLREQGDE
jgi:hypothetical protein